MLIKQDSRVYPKPLSEGCLRQAGIGISYVHEMDCMTTATSGTETCNKKSALIAVRKVGKYEGLNK